MVETSTKPPVTQAIAPSAEALYPLPDFDRKQPVWQRLLIGSACLGLGFVVISTGFASIAYRMTHATFTDGLVTGRLVRLQAPMDGEIQDFFASSGVDVQSGQVLARISPGSQQQQALTRLQGEVQEKMTQLAAARQLLTLLTSQLQSLEQQAQTLQVANTALATDDVKQQGAAVDAAIATETAARANYQRYQQLLEAGVVSRERVEQLRAEWQSAQATVQQIRAELSSAQTSLAATTQGIPIHTGGSLQEQQMGMMQALQNQASLVNTLSTQLATSQQQLEQTQSLYSKRQDVEVTAPFTGVIYSTEREAGEQVNRPDVLLTVLDCNDLWVEILVSADQARRIDTQQPVRVQLAGSTDTFLGDVELVEAISRAELAKDQAQALTPSIPEQLTGEPLARVLVKIPPVEDQMQSQRLCGVGQSAQLTFGLKWLGR